MPPIYVAIYQGGALVGDFETVEGADLAATVRAFKQHLKTWSADLAGVELRHMMVFGPWAAKPRRTEVTRLVGEGEEPCDPAATLGDLIGGMERAYLLVRITAPSSAAVAGVSVLGWHDAHPFVFLRTLGGRKFEDLLREARITPDHHVVMRAVHRYYNDMVFAETRNNVEAAVTVYNMALALPSTATAADFKTAGLSVNGPLCPGSDLTVCYKDRFQFVLKSLSDNEIRRARAFHKALVAPIPHLTTFELVTSIHHRTFMLMPRFLDVLKRCPPLAAAEALKLWEQVSAALEAIHSLGFAHMDIKPSNICMSGAGDFIVVDLGSIAPFDQFTQSTASYVPADLLPDKISVFRVPADPRVDWWMLATTLAEKGCHGNSVAIGGAKLWRMAELRVHLGMYLPAEIWRMLETKLC